MSSEPQHPDEHKNPHFRFKLAAGAASKRCIQVSGKVGIFVRGARWSSIAAGLHGRRARWLQWPRHKNPYLPIVAFTGRSSGLDQAGNSVAFARIGHMDGGIGIPEKSLAPTSKLSKASKQFRHHFPESNQWLAKSKVGFFGPKVGILVPKVWFFVNARWGFL